MMRGYQCKNKTAKEILATLGFDEHDAIRGWTMNRTGGLNNKGAPIRIHALVQTDKEGEYIDAHVDYPGPDGTHIASRGRRTIRWNQLFEQIDHGLVCDAGHKLLAHYGGLREAIKKYNAKGKRSKRKKV